MSAALVLLVALSIARFGTPSGDAPPASAPRGGISRPGLPAADVAATSPAGAIALVPATATTSPTAVAAATATAVNTPVPIAPTPTAPSLHLDQPTAAVADHGTGLLPHYRILSYYGHPNDKRMGILGKYDKDRLLTKLKEQAASYEAADPTRPVMLAFELIASVAQADPGDDGTYLLHTDDQTLNAYADFTAQHGIQLILDVQIGHSTVADEIGAVRPWLERPNVHLALDPEFAMADGQKPGVDIGGIDAADITAAQQTLAAISADKGIPPKLLIVHQFYEGMIRDRRDVSRVPGVQLVIDVDGFGQPSDKVAVYNTFNRDHPIQFNGIKLFSNHSDSPLMTPQEVLALTPSPDLIVYQ